MRIQSLLLILIFLLPLSSVATGNEEQELVTINETSPETAEPDKDQELIAELELLELLDLLENLNALASMEDTP